VTKLTWMLDRAAIPMATNGIKIKNETNNPVMMGSVKYLSGSKTGASVSFPCVELCLF